MKKGIILLVSAVAVIAAIFLIDSLHSSEKDSAKPAPATNKEQPVGHAVTAAPAATKTRNDLPELPFTQLNGVKVVAKNLKGKTMLVLFQPDCDHCQREAVQIREHLAAFDGYDLYFVSDAALPQLDRFAKEYKLNGKPNIMFAQATSNDILRTMGNIQTPSMFIYTAEGSLVKSFIGETPIEEILAVLEAPTAR